MDNSGKIPKIIHQIWFQGWDKLPSKYNVNIQSIIEKNPGWQRIQWDDKNIREVLKSLGQQYLGKYDSFRVLHQKIDFGRYAILYVYGGVSVDTDVFAIKGFDSTPDINKSSFIVSYNSSNAFENYLKSGKSFAINNATILVSKNNPILKGLLDHILGLSCDITQSKESCIQETTGPKEFTQFLDQYKNQITILDNTYFEPCNGRDFGCPIPQNSLLDHRHEGTWVSDGNKRIAQTYYFMKRYKKPLIVGFVILILLLILLFSKR